MTLQTMASLMTLQVSAYSPADTFEIIGELTVTADLLPLLEISLPLQKF